MKNVLTYTLMLFIAVFTVSAQSEADTQGQKNDRKQKHELRKEFHESLSEDQKAQLEYQRKLHYDHRKALHDTYSEEQLAIVQNEDLSRKGKQKALKSTLSDEQKEMTKSHKEAMKLEKSKFEASLNEEQLKKYGEIKKKKRKGGPKHKKGKKIDN